MITAQRAAVLAQVAARFPLLGPVTAGDLVDIVRLELGHPEILDGFRPYHGHFSRAVPVEPILHILSENTAHAGLQSLMRGLLLGAMNLVKLPRAGLAEVEDFTGMLPAGLKERVRLSGQLTEDWLGDSKAWVVFGGDETIANFRSRAGPDLVFEAHPHRVSLGIVFDDSQRDSAPFAAEDVSLFDQKGCLSPHDIYVAGDARGYAARLADEMARFERRSARGPLPPAEAAKIAEIRADYRFRQASNEPVAIWESPNSTAWTVIYEGDPLFAASCLNRVAFVKPMPADLEGALGSARKWLAAIGIWPATPENAERAAALRPSRICALGRMQSPSLAWHQEGRQTLAGLARWVDFEPDFR